jgi:hypothetical protein
MTGQLLYAATRTLLERAVSCCKLAVVVEQQFSMSGAVEAALATHPSLPASKKLCERAHSLSPSFPASLSHSPARAELCMPTSMELVRAILSLVPNTLEMKYLQQQQQRIMYAQGSSRSWDDWVTSIGVCV